MPTITTTKAVERSTYVVTVQITDETGASATPNNDIKYTLTNSDGDVINSLATVDVSPTSHTFDIILTGDDLKITPDDATDDDNIRKLLIECTYNSALGSGLHLKDQLTFSIADLTGVSTATAE